jgi:ribosomal protein L37AE/L43A
VSQAAGAAGSRAGTPYLCPFCGEEDLRPADQGRWHCRSCLRLFSLTFHGLAAPEASTLPSTLPSTRSTEWSDD